MRYSTHEGTTLSDEADLPQRRPRPDPDRDRARLLRAADHLPPQQDSKPTYSDFIAQINGDSTARRRPEIKSVTMKTSDNTLDVAQTDGTEYSTGYPPNTEEQLVNTLERQNIETTVEGRAAPRSSRCSPTSCRSS